jgi:peroxin-1
LEDRVDILRALGKKLKLSNDILSGSSGGLEEIATQTEGYSGADLQALVYNAHLEAIHDVLGHQDHPETVGKKGPGKANGATLTSTRHFVQFRYGEEEDRLEAEIRARAGHNKTKLLAERATIAQKLDEIKKAKRRAKQLQRGLDDRDDGDARDGEELQDGQRENEVVICWEHIERSLQSTRASISADERRRLQGIYREFVVGRNGEMPSGEGARDVGGRTSLM